MSAFLNVGDQIKNGAHVLEARGNIALCYWAQRGELVVWRVDNDGYAHNGDYARTLSEAMRYLDRRSEVAA